MADRLELQSLLEDVLGSRNVYFQPPASKKLNYPAIVYKRNDIRNTFAEDQVYQQAHFYEVTVIDYNPDSPIALKVSKLPRTKWNRYYPADGLNHYVFIINY
jgi:hypothetical protein